MSAHLTSQIRKSVRKHRTRQGKVSAAMTIAKQAVSAAMGGVTGRRRKRRKTTKTRRRRTRR